MAHKHYISERSIMHFRANKQGVFRIAILAFTSIPLIGSENGLVVGLMEEFIISFRLFKR
jgi:hypothetical protein